MAARNPTHWLGTAGSVLALLAPKGLCPICVATSGGLLSAIGLGFLAVDGIIRWVLPIVLLLGVLGLAVSARAHRRWWVLGMGALGAAVLYMGWFLTVSPVLYLGMSILVGASALTFWAKRYPKVQLVQLRLRKTEMSHGKA